MGSLVFLALPLVVYASLATLPMGRPAVIGLGVAGLMLELGYVLVPDNHGLLTFALAGAVMAATAQALRWLAGARLAPRLYLALLGLLPLLVLLVLTFSLGD